MIEGAVTVRHDGDFFIFLVFFHAVTFFFVTAHMHINKDYAMHDDDQQDSREQQEWESLADGILGHLKAQAKLMPAMKLEEVKALVDASDLAMNFHARAKTFDKRVALELARTSVE